MSFRQKLSQELDDAYQEFLSAVHDLDEHTFERKWLDGRWGVREIVAHHTGWFGQLGGGLERMARGEKPTPEGVDWTDVQPWNERFAQHAKGKLKGAVLDELAHAVTAFMEAATRLPDDRFVEGKTVHKMFDAAGISHFRESSAMVRRWRQEEMRTA